MLYKATVDQSEPLAANSLQFYVLLNKGLGAVDYIKRAEILQYVWVVSYFRW